MNNVLMNAVNFCMMSIMVLLQHDSMYWNWECLVMPGVLVLSLIVNCKL